MVVQGSDKTKGSKNDGDDGCLTLRRDTSPSKGSTFHPQVMNPISNDNPNYGHVGVLLPEKSPQTTSSLATPRMSNLGSQNSDVPIKKRPNTTTMPSTVKRSFDNNSVSNNIVKKSKVTPFNNQQKDDTPLLRKFEMSVDKSADKLASSSKKGDELAKNLVGECTRKTNNEEKTSDSIQRTQYSKERGNMKKKISCVEGFEDSLKKMEEKIGECVKESAVKLFREHKQSIMELKTKEDELNAIKYHFDRQTDILESKKKDFELEKKHFEEQVKELESKEKLFEGRENEHELKVKEFITEKKHFNIRMRALKSKEQHFEERLKEVDSKEKKLKILEKEVELEKKQLEELQSQKEEFKAQMQELKSFVCQVEGFKP